MIYFLTPADSDWTVREYLSRWGRDMADRIRIRHYEDLFPETTLERGTYVLSGLCGLTEETRRRLETLRGRLDREGGFRFLNRPTRTLRRFGLLEELARRGWNEFRAVRASGDFEGLRYPVFLRAERTHDGAQSPLLHSPREVEAAIGRSLFHGRPLSDMLVVEFCDTRDAKGYYRKYSAFAVGDRVLPRNLECGRAWMLKHSRAEFTPATLAEEREFLIGNPHEAQLRRIFEAAGVEYGRIDYAVRDGRVQTWEINLLPTIGRGPGPEKHLVPKDLEPYREETKAIFYRSFREAWEAVDLPGGGRPPVSVAVESVSGSAENVVERSASRLTRAVRLAPRPLRRLAELLGAPLFPTIGRAALQRARARSG